MSQHVSIHYLLKADGPEGEELERTEEPLRFTLGADEVLPALEAHLVGMELGETKQFMIPCDQAFGPYDEDLMRDLPKHMFVSDEDPQGDFLEEGGIVMLTDEHDEDQAAMIVEIGNEKVTVDLNHPLAGEDLWYDVELVSVG